MIPRAQYLQAQAVSTILSISESEEEEVILILLVIDVTLTWSASFMEHFQMLFFFKTLPHKKVRKISGIIPSYFQPA